MRHALRRRSRLRQGLIQLLYVGEELRRDLVVMVLRGGSWDESDGELVEALDSGADRTFDQDPLFAFRLLADIGLRALSSAVNDPFTAVQAIGVDQLLTWARDTPPARQRLADMVDDLLATAPPARRAALEERRSALASAAQ